MLRDWRATFNLIESAGESAVANDMRHESQAALAWISATIESAFKLAKEQAEASGGTAWPLDGSDACERVAEALAVWLQESAPRRFANMTGTRYSVSGVDDAAEGMERLRDQSEFILVAYASGGESPAEIGEQWLRDVDSCGREDGFDYDAAEHAIRQYISDATESGYLDSLIGRARDVAGSDESADEMESTPLRLYVRDNAPDAGK
jgi:hypothetical protein